MSFKLNDTEESVARYAEWTMAWCTKYGLPKAYCDAVLERAEPLIRRGLPVLLDTQHLASELGLPLRLLYRIANRPERFYRQFLIKKRAGGNRVISEPLPMLKSIQRHILCSILNQISAHPCAHAYERGRSIRTNARFHLRQHQMIKLDLTNFFGSIEPWRVHRVFHLAGYTNAIAGLLTGLCRYESGLAQGAITSPALSNLVAWRLDRRLFTLCRQYELRYTRYADDITISGSFRGAWLLPILISIVQDEGFEVNHRKTQILTRQTRMEVTGVVTNERLQVSRKYRLELRQAVYYIRKYGLADHCKRIRSNRANYLEHLIGRHEHAFHIDPSNVEVASNLRYLRSLRTPFFENNDCDDSA